MILLYGETTDRPMADVLEGLQRIGADYLLLDSAAAVSVASEWPWPGVLQIRERLISLKDVTAAYLRPCETQVPKVNQLILDWANLTSAIVVNVPDKMAANHSKPYQLLQIRKCGFTVPDTLITSSAKDLAAFRSRHKKVIYKSISGVRSIVSIITSNQEDRLTDLQWCPTQFQEYIQGVDYRIHVVGQRLFGARINSPATDYRYASLVSQPVQIIAWTPPDHLAERVVSLCRTLGLLVAGVDLRLTDDGDWVCFEVNPSPAFSYYSQHTGQPIADSIAKLLSKS